MSYDCRDWRWHDMSKVGRFYCMTTFAKKSIINTIKILQWPIRQSRWLKRHIGEQNHCTLKCSYQQLLLCHPVLLCSLGRTFFYYQRHGIIMRLWWYCYVDECLLRLKTRLSSSKTSWPVTKDLLEFNTRYERIMSWLMQKEKMASLLVPVGCKLPVISNQLMQTRVSHRFSYALARLEAV